MKTLQRGAALLIVLWACALLAIVLAGYAMTSRLAANQSRMLLTQTQAYYLAESVLMRTLYQQYQPAQTAPVSASVPLDGRPLQWQQAGYQIQRTVRDEQGRIDLNQAPEPLLQRWLQVLGAPHAAAVARAIGQWRGATAVAEGSEDARGFSSIEELGQIPGISLDLAQAMAADATLWSGQVQPEIGLASATVSAAMTGATLAQARQQVRNRPLPAADGTSAQARVESLQIIVSRGQVPLAILSATLRLEPSLAPRPYRVLQWQEGGPPWPR